MSFDPNLCDCSTLCPVDAVVAETKVVNGQVVETGNAIISSDCVSCGWCETACPIENIELDGGTEYYKIIDPKLCHEEGGCLTKK